jgi:hypothetical protein
MDEKSPRTFFWPIFGVVILASALSLAIGLLAVLIGLAIHIALCARRKAPARPTSVILIVFAPVFGMIASAILFLLGPGF